MNIRSLPKTIAASLLLAAAFAFATPAAAELKIVEPPAKPGPAAADASAEQKKEIAEADKKATLHLGGTLTISATGTDAAEILIEVDKPSHRTLTLYLNGVEIPDLTSTYLEVVSQAEADAFKALVTAAKKAATDLADADKKVEAERKILVSKAAELTAAEKTAADTAKAVTDAGVNATEPQKNAETEARARVVVLKKPLEEAQADQGIKQKASDEAEAAVVKKQGHSVAQVDLSFVVDRHSANEDSRNAWNTLLRPLRGGASDLTVALAVGEGNPRRVDRAGKIGVRVLAFEAPYCVWYGYLMGFVVVLICLVIIGCFPETLRDGGNPEYAFSLARTQMAFWGIVVLASFTGVLFALHSLEFIPSQTLILMGISATTGLSARLVDTGRPPTLKSGKGRWDGFWPDICVGDAGASFHRVQIVLWTVVLGGYFIYNVCDVISMPEFNETLLILMGISHGTYLGFKMQEGTFGITPLKVKDSQLESEITGGTGPFQWTLTSAPEEAVKLDPASKAGSLIAPGPISIKLPVPFRDGRLTLAVTDKAGSAASFSLDVKKMEATDPVLDAKNNKITTSVKGGTTLDNSLGRTWVLTGKPDVIAKPDSGEIPASGEVTIPLPTILTTGNVIVTIKDAQGLVQELKPVAVTPPRPDIKSLSYAAGKVTAVIEGGKPDYEWTLAVDPTTAVVVTNPPQPLTGKDTDVNLDIPLQLVAATTPTLTLTVKDSNGQTSVPKAHQVTV